MDAIRDLIEETVEPTTTDYWRVRIRTQQELWEDGATLRTEDAAETDNGPPQYKGGKWGQYLRGPDSWFELYGAGRGPNDTPAQPGNHQPWVYQRCRQVLLRPRRHSTASRQHPGPSGIPKPGGESPGRTLAASA